MTTSPENNDRPDELVAFLDGELDDRAARDLERRIGREPKLRARADALKKTWELLDFLPQPEPSPTFTTRTLDKVAVLKPASRTSPSVPAAVAIEMRSRHWLKALAWTAGAVVLFVAAFGLSGPLVRPTPKPQDPQLVDAEMAQDLRVLDNLTLYQYGDDLKFLFALDQSDLFGDEAAR